MTDPFEPLWPNDRRGLPDLLQHEPGGQRMGVTRRGEVVFLEQARTGGEGSRKKNKTHKTVLRVGWLAKFPGCQSRLQI